MDQNWLQLDWWEVDLALWMESVSSLGNEWTGRMIVTLPTQIQFPQDSIPMSKMLSWTLNKYIFIIPIQLMQNQRTLSTILLRMRSAQRIHWGIAQRIYQSYAFPFVKKWKEHCYFLLSGWMVSLSLAKEITLGVVGKTFALAWERYKLWIFLLVGIVPC